MAKNLKLNIKNTQLAEALKLTPPKKPAVKKTTSSEPVPEEAAKSIPKEIETPSIPEPIPSALPETKKQEIQEIEIAAPVKETPARFQEEFSESPKPPIRKLTPPERKPLSLSRRDDQEPRPIRRDLSSSYTPRREGSSFPVKREGGPSFPIKREPGTYPVRREGSSFPVKREGSPFPVRREGGNFPVRTGFRPAGSGFGSQNRSPLPPVKEPPKELPQQQQQYKKHTSHHANTDKDAKSLKKESENRAFDVRDRQGLREGDEERWRKRKSIKTRSEQQDETIRPKTLKIRLPISIKDLAAEMKLKASQLIAKLFMQGLVLTLNDFLDDETTVQLLGTEFDCDISIDTSEQERIQITGKTVREEILEANPAGLRLRPPVVAFMGHVDHGKTSLIDSIRKSNVADSEAGAITQHIGAFTCKTPVGTITVLDTPGHEAFSSMRERGAEVTDIAVLVIAGDEGIKAQTLEAIRQAKDAGVCLVVALNKCDKPNFDAETVYRQLADQDLLPEAWGGTVITVNCSAVTGEGIKELLEMLALQAEILELKADPEARARGSVIESELHKGLGPVATVLIQNGTLHPGDALVFDECYARVKTMFDEHEQELSEAGPSTPVKITGLSGIPPAGSEFIVVKNEKEAREIAEKRVGQRHHLLLQAKKGSLESFLQSKAEASSRKILKVIVKADVQGSLEALKTSLRKLPSEKVEIVFVSEGVGEVSESDIQFAATSKAVIIGFHTGIESHAEPLMKQLKVDVRLHDIIYRAVDDIKALMLDLLDKIAKENDLGEAIVKAVFKSSQIGSIAGCSVSKGIIRRNCHARVVRNNEVIWKGPIASLKRVKEDVKEVSKGLECGILLQGFHDYKEEDRIEAFEITYLQQELT